MIQVQSIDLMPSHFGIGSHISQSQGEVRCIDLGMIGRRQQKYFHVAICHTLLCCNNFSYSMYPGLCTRHRAKYSPRTSSTIWHSASLPSPNALARFSNESSSTQLKPMGAFRTYGTLSTMQNLRQQSMLPNRRSYHLFSFLDNVFTIEKFHNNRLDNFE